MTEFSLVLSVALSAICAAAAIWCARSAAVARVSLARMQQLAGSFPSGAADRLDALEEITATLANRVKMQKVRAASTHAAERSDGMPDPYRDPDAWRRAMNRTILRPIRN